MRRLDDLSRLATVKQSWTSLPEDPAVGDFGPAPTDRVGAPGAVFLVVLPSHVVSVDLLYSRSVKSRRARDHPDNRRRKAVWEN